jgi:hypothetical protein
LKPSIAFISTMEGDSWGGSEELWSRTALRLAAQGLRIFASMLQWPVTHHRSTELMKGGVHVQFRPRQYSVWRRAWRKANPPWFGTGQGTFAWAYPAYRSDGVPMWGTWDRTRDVADSTDALAVLTKRRQPEVERRQHRT